MGAEWQEESNYVLSRIFRDAAWGQIVWRLQAMESTLEFCLSFQDGG